MPPRPHLPHLDGLRGLALLLVLLHHLRLLPGGYIGVDIFFTLSGYLITHTLHSPLPAFYLRRVARLFPALFVTLFVTLLFFPVPQVAESSLAASFSLSNFLFHSQAGYFDLTSSEKPLLHTWSLAVEEQFYLIYPLIFKSLGPSRLPPLLALLALLSFLLSTHLLQHSPTAAFYLPHPRFWELLVGALLALRPPPSPTPRVANLLVLLSSTALILPAFLYSDHTPFPGPAALPPTLGAALLIHAGSSSSLAAWLFGNYWLGAVGRVSYSLYLAHWPSIVLLGPNLWGAAASVAAGVALFAGVENVWRLRGNSKGWRKEHWVRWGMFVGIVVSAAVCVGLGMKVVRGKVEGGLILGGMAGALAEVEKVQSRAVRVDWERVNQLEGWVTGGADTNGEVLVIGDSHAGRMLWLGNYLGRKYSTSWHVWSLPACLPLFGVRRVSKSEGVGQGRVKKEDEAQCDGLVERWREAVRGDRFRWVFLVGRWSTSVEEGEYWKRGPLAEWRLQEGGESGEGARMPSLNESRAVFKRALRRTVREIRATGKQVVLMGEVPDVGRGSFKCKRWLAVQGRRKETARAAQPGACVGAERKLVGQRLKWVERELDAVKEEMGDGVEVVASRKYMCDNEKQDVRHCRVLWGSSMLYRDSDHLSETGSLYLASRWEGDRDAWFPWRLE